jgi:hypothetical protein
MNTFGDFKENITRFKQGLLLDKIGNNYRVKILDFMGGWIMDVKETALGIPIQTKHKDICGRDIMNFGVVRWETDFDAAEIEVFTEKGLKRVPKTEIKRMRSWPVD